MKLFTTFRENGPFAALTLCFLLTLSGCKDDKTASTDLKTEDDKVAYAIGVSVGKSLKQEKFDANSDLVAAGIRDALADKIVLSADELRSVMANFQQKLRAQREAELKAIGEKNLREGTAFLEANKLKPGVQTTASGLQYQIISSGTGKTPKPTDTVSLNFRAALIDNTEIDSSQKHGRPLILPVKTAMAGWSEALQMMKEGDKWKVFVPANLGFGPRSVSAQVGPNTTLIYDLELIAVNPPQPTAPPPGLMGKPPLPPGNMISPMTH